MSRVLQHLSTTGMCMTTMQILTELRAAAPICKDHVRTQLTQGIANGTITCVAGVYYVVTAQNVREALAGADAALSAIGPRRRAWWRSSSSLI